MPDSYFRQMTDETPTRVWVNNPTVDELRLALAQGAVGCTTNPAYGGNLLKRAPDHVWPIIAEVVRTTDDDDVAADLVQRALVYPIVERLRPLFDDSEGRYGYVSVQGAPEADTQAANIVAQGRANHAIGPNAAPKIPATAPGLEALEVLVAEGYPTIVTEVFSLAQLVEACERYRRVTDRTGIRPPFFVCPITGIFGDHLKAVALQDSQTVAKQDIELVGVALSRECYRLVQERGYAVTLVCGGARIPFDLTGLVGAALHCTVNWTTFAEILGDPTAFAPGLGIEIDPAAIERLANVFPEVRQALTLDGLAVEEFERFGPVQHFRNNFIAGWAQIREAVAEARTRASAVVV